MIGRMRVWTWIVALTLLAPRAGVGAPNDGDGSTALHWAVYHDDVEATERLIRAGSDVNAANDLGATPLWFSCENGSVRIVRQLLTAGASPNVALLSGETPLMTAARGGNVEVVEALLASGANPDAKEPSRNQTALMWAVSQRHPGVVRALLQYGADPNARSTSYTQVVKTSPQATNPAYISEFRQGGFTPLLFAARVGDLASARLLVAAGADVNDQAASGASAAVVAAHSGHGDLASYLLDAGADAAGADAGYTLLHAALLHRDRALVVRALEKGADPNVSVLRPTPIRRDSVDFYLDPSFVGATPLWLAARFNAPDIMRVLLAHGADPRVIHRPTYFIGEGPARPKDAPPSPDPDRRLIEEGDTTTVMAAVGLGGRRPLFSVELAGRLAETARGDARRTATDEAIVLETVMVAIESGADVNLANAEGKTAWQAATERGYDRVAAYLVERGAVPIAQRTNGQPLAVRR